MFAAFRKLTLPTPGARILKTALAVTVSVWITARALGDDYIAFAGISAVLSIQPTWEEVRSTSWSQIAGSLAGALWGIMAAAVFVNNPIWIGINVYLMFTLGKWLKSEKIAALGVTVMLLTMVQSDHASYALHRVIGAVIGLAVGAGINFLLWKPPADAAPTGSG